jgi:DNA (cytosine-5)-methyltransferase 1
VEDYEFLLSTFYIDHMIYCQQQIEVDVLNACNYGVPQTRPRAIIRIYKKDLQWNLPEKESTINLEKAIGHLPSLESGESSDIPWHYAKDHNDRDVLAMRHTPQGKSAIKNEFYYPKKVNGDRIRGFHNTYKRMKWNDPAHARTTNSGNIFYVGHAEIMTWL